MPIFVTKNEVLRAHETQIQLFGGSTGIRDMGLLESALAMPQISFGGQFLHGDVYERAAYIQRKFEFFGNRPPVFPVTPRAGGGREGRFA